MKGVILAGGLGSRLFPVTKVVNKHMLPIYNKPMIFYPLNTLISLGIKEVLITSNKKGIASLSQLLGSGEEFGVEISYRIQEKAGGISDALKLARGFASNQSIAMILGDNIFLSKIDISNFKEGAQIFLKEVDKPEEFGIAEMRKGKIINIEEKPKNPKSNLCVTGLYLYDNTVFSKIETLKPSARGELEITDLNNAYLREGKLFFSKVGGLWLDAGTDFDELHQSSKAVKEFQDSQKN